MTGIEGFDDYPNGDPNYKIDEVVKKFAEKTHVDEITYQDKEAFFPKGF